MYYVRADVVCNILAMNQIAFNYAWLPDWNGSLLFILFTHHYGIALFL